MRRTASANRFTVAVFMAGSAPDGQPGGGEQIGDDGLVGVVPTSATELGGGVDRLWTFQWLWV